MSGNDAPAVCQSREPYGFGLRQHFGRRKAGGHLRSAPIGSRLARLGLGLGLALQLHVVKFWFGLNCLGILKAGVGVIIRDHRGFVVAVEASPVLGCSFVELLEAQGCLEGLQLALDVGISSVVLEFDAVGVIKLFSNQIVPRTEMGAIMKDYLALTNLEGLVSIVVVRREANSVVHSLAQLALSLEGLVVWLDELPMDIIILVHLDFFFFLQLCLSLLSLPKKKIFFFLSSINQ
ncbi:hypothetical protein LWI29_019598 [Acer saccharum]|uniref:RNase H type-1 domain-containing protein n=1 Tax=Acer saccharum TaxID=4024 RepID=A0AA39RRT7_ACESA|nr:hypothetical protein LWI29_019598 [Acer saccharum]